MKKSCLIIEVFQKASFILNVGKSQIISDLKFSWLRISWCSRTDLLYLSAYKVLSYSDATAVLLNQRSIFLPLRKSARKFNFAGVCNDLVKLSLGIREKEEYLCISRLS